MTRRINQTIDIQMYSLSILQLIVPQFISIWSYLDTCFNLSAFKYCLNVLRNFLHFNALLDFKRNCVFGRNWRTIRSKLFCIFIKKPYFPILVKVYENNAPRAVTSVTFGLVNWKTLNEDALVWISKNTIRCLV